MRIPEGIPPPAQGFDETSFFWEMETIEKEVTGVRFRYTPAFSKRQDTLVATLEMPEGGDVSIFDKVLPAIISDSQSLKSALDPQKANLSANIQARYQKIILSVKPETGQTTKISWEFEKNTLTEDLSNLYLKLKYPEPILRILYSLPHLTFSLLGA